MFVLQKNGSIHKNRKWPLHAGIAKITYICPKVTKMGSIIGHRIDYNEVRGKVSERPAAHTQQKLTQVPPTPETTQGKYNVLK